MVALISHYPAKRDNSNSKLVLLPDYLNPTYPCAPKDTIVQNKELIRYRYDKFIQTFSSQSCSCASFSLTKTRCILRLFCSFPLFIESLLYLFIYHRWMCNSIKSVFTCSSLKQRGQIQIMLLNLDYMSNVMFQLADCQTLSYNCCSLNAKLSFMYCCILIKKYHK